MDIGRIIWGVLYGLLAAFVVWLLFWAVGLPSTVWPVVVGVLVAAGYIFTSFPRRPVV